MLDKNCYTEFCENRDDIPIFSQPFWLDAVCGEDWNACVIKSGGQVIATLPFYIKKRGPFKAITMPPLTQNFYLFLDYGNKISTEKRLSFEHETISALIDELPYHDMFNINFYRTLTNWQPFFNYGFNQTTHYTYVIEDLTDIDALFREWSHAKRKNIKKAVPNVSVTTDIGATDFYVNHRMTLAKQNARISYSQDLIERIFAAVYANNSGKTFAAFDKDNNLHAAILLIWDKIQAYYLISSIDPDFRNSGAATLLIKEAIEYVASKTTKLDFEGSMIEGVARSFRQFGTSQVPYFRLSKVNSRIIKLMSLKNILT